MDNETEVSYPADAVPTATVYIVILLFVIVVHIAIIYVILKRTCLAKKRLYIVASISTFDCFGSLFILIWYIQTKGQGYFDKDISSYVLPGVITSLFRVSLFCTCLLSLDRFIAVSRPLRYPQIVTTERIFKAIFSYLALSLFLLLISQFIPEHNAIGILGITIFHILVTSMFILFLAGYTIKIRKRHIASLRARRLQSGVQAEKLSLLKAVKGSLHDVMLLNILTVIFIILIGIFSLLTLLLDEEMFIRMRALTFSLYVVSNPIIYISVLRELRVEIKKIFCRNNRVNVGRTDPVNRATFNSRNNRVSTQTTGPVNRSIFNNRNNRVNIERTGP